MKPVKMAEPVGYNEPRIEKTAVAVNFPKGFDPTVEYTPEGDAIVRMRVSVRQIEAYPLQFTDQFREFCHRADFPEHIMELSMMKAEKAFRKEFAKLQVIEKLRIAVED